MIRDRDLEFLGNAIATIEEILLTTEKEISIALDYCLAIKVILKRKSVYPTKPGGLRLYQQLMEIKDSLVSCYCYNENRFLRKLISLVSEVIDDEVSEYVKYLTISYQWIYKITSKLKVSQGSEEQAQQNLIHVVNSFSHHDDPTLCEWLSHIKRVTTAWLPGLFRYLAQPLLPKNE